jgi:hypothetical protein
MLQKHKPLNGERQDNLDIVNGQSATTNGYNPNTNAEQQGSKNGAHYPVALHYTFVTPKRAMYGPIKWSPDKGVPLRIL